MADEPETGLKIENHCIRVRRKVWQRAQDAAFEDGIPLIHVIEDALQRYADRQLTVGPPARPYRQPSPERRAQASTAA